MKPLFILVMLLCVVGCNPNPNQKHNNPPPGFSVLCDNKGHYAVQWPSGGIDSTDYDHKEITNRDTALYVAWRQYEYEKANETKEIKERLPWRDYHDCNN